MVSSANARTGTLRPGEEPKGKLPSRKRSYVSEGSSRSSRSIMRSDLQAALKEYTADLTGEILKSVPLPAALASPHRHRQATRTPSCC